MYFEITTSIYPGNTSSGYLVSCLHTNLLNIEYWIEYLVLKLFLTVLDGSDSVLKDCRGEFLFMV